MMYSFSIQTELDVTPSQALLLLIAEQNILSGIMRITRSKLPSSLEQQIHL